MDGVLDDTPTGHGVMVPICLEFIGRFFMCHDQWQYPHASLRALAALMKVKGYMKSANRKC